MNYHNFRFNNFKTLIISASLFYLISTILCSVGFSQTPTPEQTKVISLFQKAVRYEETRNYKEAIILYEEAVSLGEIAYGPANSNFGALLSNLALLYRKTNDFSKAEKTYERALSTLEKALGPEHLHVGDTLNSLAITYKLQGKLAQAIPLLRRALAIREKNLGTEHPDVAQSLSNLGVIYHAQGKYSQAESFLNKALSIRMTVLGPEHPDVAMNLNNIAALYSSMGDYAKAKDLYHRSLAIIEKAFGPSHPNVAIILDNLAVEHYHLGNYDQGEKLSKQALSIWEKISGPENLDVASSLSILGGLYYEQGEYHQAEECFKRALSIREKILGPDHPEVAINLSNLAEVYHTLGNRHLAMSLGLRALSLLEKTLGPDHLKVASILHNLARMYQGSGDYTKSLELYQKSLSIKEKVLGVEHPDVATTLNNLAVVYKDLGDFNRSISLYEKSLALRESALGTEHTSVATTLNNLGDLYCSVGDYTKANSLYLQSLAILEKKLGTEHYNVAGILNNLALVNSNLGNYDYAESLAKRSLDIINTSLGAEHPSVAAVLSSLAGIYGFNGKFKNAESLYIKSLDIRKKAFGTNHPLVALSFFNLASVYAAEEDYDNALKYMIHGLEIDQETIDQVLGITSDEQKMQFISMKVSKLNGFLTLVSQHLPHLPYARKTAMDAWLKRKGLVLDTHRRVQNALVYSDDPDALNTFEELSGIRAQLSKLAFSGPENKDYESYKKRIATLESKKEELEIRLSRLSQNFALNQGIAKADSEKVARALPPNSVLLDFAKIDIFNFKDQRKGKAWGAPHYLVFILQPGDGNKITLVDLGEADEIDRNVSRFKKEILNQHSLRGEKDIESLRNLYQLVFANLQKEIKGTKKIFISPDGQLSLIPFEILQRPDGKSLIEDYTFNYLAAGRDILRFAQIKEQGDKVLLMGDPDFDMVTEEKDSFMEKLSLDKTGQGGDAKRSSDMSGLHFSRLPGTKEEVLAIKSLLGKKNAEVYTGKEALEEVLQKKGTPSILHLATHGFFLSDLELAPPEGVSVDRGIQLKSIALTTTGQRVKVGNPLLRSGIALAGANNSIKSADEDKNDGIVTAEKILGLKLRGTDMVVLSACETGLGEVKSGEGVFGFRRVFTQAGARSLVMSMWSVPDEETKELMIEFYKNIQSGEMNRCQALRQAALKEMKLAKKRYGYANPLYWGAFVFMGEP